MLKPWRRMQFHHVKCKLTSAVTLCLKVAMVTSGLNGATVTILMSAVNGAFYAGLDPHDSLAAKSSDTAGPTVPANAAG